MTGKRFRVSKYNYTVKSVKSEVVDNGILYSVVNFIVPGGERYTENL